MALNSCESLPYTCSFRPCAQVMLCNADQLGAILSGTSTSANLPAWVTPTIVRSSRGCHANETK